MSPRRRLRGSAGRLGLEPAAFLAQLRVMLAVQLQYRAVLLIWLLFFVLKPVIFLSVWSTIARSSGGQVGGRAPADLAAYFLVTMWIIHLTFVYLLEVEGRVRRGEYSRLLLRPAHPIYDDLAANLAFKALTVPVLAAATVVLVLLFRPRLEPPLWAIAAFVPSLGLAFVLRFVNGWALSLVAFWLTRLQAVVQAYLFVLSYLAGELAPLDLLPGWAQTAAWLSPFGWMLAFPAELLLGRLSPTQALIGLAAQLLWALLSLALLPRCWRAAVRRYGAVGG